MKLTGLKQLIEAAGKPPLSGMGGAGGSGQGTTNVWNTSWDTTPITLGLKAASYVNPLLQNPDQAGNAMFGMASPNRAAASVQAQKYLQSGLWKHLGNALGPAASALPPTRGNLVGRLVSNPAVNNIAQAASGFANSTLGRVLAPQGQGFIKGAARLATLAGLGGHDTGWGTGGAK